MPEIITYSLKTNQEDSDEYYSIISDLCDEVFKHVTVELKDLLTSFKAWDESNDNPQNSSIEEDTYTLLSLGILWQQYAAPAKASRRFNRWILTRLVNLRRKNTVLKPIADLLRGILTGLTSYNKNKEVIQPDPTLQNLDLLLGWLQASGEYDEIISNLRKWRDFLSSKSTSEIESKLLKLQNLAEWFTNVSLKQLGKYTENVNHFLEVEHPNYRWREDYHFTGINQIEYHLNMLGSELLNRSLKVEFQKTSHKIVILPPCMKAKAEDECLAISTSFGEKCMHCTPSCRINQITLLGEKHGFQVNIIPDDLKIFSGDSDGSDKLRSVAVLGVSCPLTNAQGGLEMIHMGVPAQGLPLDYCGCSYHWHKDGIPTDLNIRELMRLLGAASPICD